MNDLLAFGAGCLLVATMSYTAVLPRRRVRKAAVPLVRETGEAVGEAESARRDHRVTADG